MKRTIFLFSLALSVFVPVRGQDPAPSGPKPPADPQAVLPDTVSFTKRFTYPAGAPSGGAAGADQKRGVDVPAAPQLGDVKVVKTGDVEQVVQHYNNGRTVEMWKAGSHSFLADGTPPHILIAGPGMSSDGTESTLPIPMNADFQELAWVHASLFTGEEVQAGVRCFAFKDAARHQSAWIEETKHLPIRFDSPRVNVLYTYQVPPAVPLQLPANYVKALTDSKRAWSGGPP